MQHQHASGYTSSHFHSQSHKLTKYALTHIYTHKHKQNKPSYPLLAHTHTHTHMHTHQLHNIHLHTLARHQGSSYARAAAQPLGTSSHCMQRRHTSAWLLGVRTYFHVPHRCDSNSRSGSCTCIFSRRHASLDPEPLLESAPTEHENVSTDWCSDNRSSPV